MDETIEYRVKQVQAGHTEEYAQIVQMFQRPIYVYCWRLLGNQAEAEDAVQDILVHAYQKIGMYTPRVSFSSWLYKMAYRHCLNLIRRQNLQRKFKQCLFPFATTADSAEQVMTRQLFSEPLSRALDQLTVEERNLLVLRIFEEKSFQEIGDIVNKSPDAVKKQYARTRTKLKKTMMHMEEELQCENYPSALKNKV